jgi:dTDP-glucose 4,6-dehydratase
LAALAALAALPPALESRPPGRIPFTVASPSRRESAVRTLITGGAGFVGSHLCERFLAEGHDVVCVDNFITGRPDNVRHLQANPKFRIIVHDVSKPLYVDGLVDNVLHFASPASPVDYVKAPIQTLKVGSLGTHVALGIAKAHGARFLLASTSEVYGDPVVHPQTEDYWGNVNPVGERSMYDEAKRFAEALTMAYLREHGVNTHIVRIFNSVLADQTVVAFDDDGMYLGPVGELADRTGG